MGLFDFLTKKKASAGAPTTKADREVARYARLVESKLSQNFDRQEAIEALGRMGTAASAAALLKRFNWSMDPSITDHEEKEAAARGIAQAGENALEPIREYCKRAPSLTWPIKVLEDIVPREHLVDELLGLLDLFDTEYTRNSEPKIQLIDKLSEHPCEEVRVAVEPFLGDMGEPVRFTSVQTVFSVNDEASLPALVAALEEEESLRVKNRIAQGLVERGWTVPEELRESCAASLPTDYFLDPDGRVRSS
jgi:HEAT repeat protein